MPPGSGSDKKMLRGRRTLLLIRLSGQARLQLVEVRRAGDYYFRFARDGIQRSPGHRRRRLGGGRFGTARASNDPSSCSSWEPVRQVRVTRTGLKRLKLPDQIMMNSYLLAHGSAPPKEEVSAPRLEGVKRIVRRWMPFN